MSRGIRDLTAAVTGAVVILAMVIGHKGGGVRAPKPLESGTPDIGVYYAKETAETAPDRFAAAGDPTAISTATSTSPDTVESRTGPTAQTVVQLQPAPNSSTTPSVDPTATKLEANTKDASTKQNEAQTPTEASSAPAEKAGSSPQKTDPAKADAPPERKIVNQTQEPVLPPTPVEPQPKKVSHMSPDEIQKALEDYKGWVHRGRIRMLVDHSSLTAEQLRSVAEAYVMTTSHSRLCVDQNGRRCDLPAELPANLMIGDVPTSKWPQMLSDRAHDFFGKNHGAHATLLFSDSTTLQLFRNLAYYVGDEVIPPGTEFTLRLATNEKGKVNVQAIDAWIPGELTEDMR